MTEGNGQMTDEQLEALTAPATAIDPFASDDDAETRPTTGLTIDQLFPLASAAFKPVDGEVYEPDDLKKGRYTRVVANVAIEMAGSGFYIGGTVREVQKVREAEAHLEFGFIGSRRGSAINSGGNAVRKADLESWKDRIIEAWKAHADAIGLVPGSPLPVTRKHVLTGVSLIAS